MRFDSKRKTATNIFLKWNAQIEFIDEYEMRMRADVLHKRRVALHCTTIKSDETAQRTKRKLKSSNRKCDVNDCRRPPPLTPRQRRYLNLLKYIQRLQSVRKSFGTIPIRHLRFIKFIVCACVRDAKRTQCFSQFSVSTSYVCGIPSAPRIQPEGCGHHSTPMDSPLSRVWPKIETHVVWTGPGTLLTWQKCDGKHGQTL